VLTMLHLSRTQSIWGMLIGLVAQAGALAVIFNRAARVETEIWTGLLVAISVLTYARREWITAAVLGLGALFIRELAAPYCIVCALLAIRGRRTRELAVWLVGGLGYVLFYAIHVMRVRQQYQPGDSGGRFWWIVWGGIRFNMEAIQQTNSLLVGAPHWVLAAAVTVLAASLWASTAPLHLRGVVIAYSVFFAVAGWPFNDYWGFVTAPTYALAFVYGIEGMRALSRRSVLSPPDPGCSRIS
jgi:hypothetical protein